MTDQLLTHLRSIGFAPRLIFDIGAHEGAFTQTCRRYFANAAVWAFEPNLGKRVALTTIADRIFTDVLLDTAGAVTYWEAEIPEQSGNGLARERTNVPFRATIRQAVAIDTLVGGTIPDLVKLDTQGTELAILRGGRDSICHAESVIMEVSFRRYNDGAPLFAEALAFMADLDYCIVDIEDAYRAQGILVQSNALFLKKKSPHFSEDVRIEFRL